MILLEVFRAGTIRDLFSPKRNVPKKAGYNAIDLPQVETQCVHVDVEELSGGLQWTRCTKDSDSTGRHGWLCLEHGADHVVAKRQEPRDKDAEVVAGIIAYERRALAGGRS